MATKILIAEDDKSLLKILTQQMEDLGYTTIQANSGDEALKKFKKEKPDLVFLDLVMPGRSGFDVLEEIRFKLKSKVKVIVVSNLDQPQDIETAKNLGVTEYINKSTMSLRELGIRAVKALEFEGGGESEES